jgi:DNA-binding NtrC family response regulator
MSTLRRNVLVVDDEAVVRQSFLRSLEGAQCDVEAVADGGEALRVMERNAFDLVMLDLRMPGLDGMAVLRTIKERWPEIEVVVITGYPSVESVKEAIRLGASDYLAKPVGPEEVINAACSAILHKEWKLRRGGPEPDRANQGLDIPRGERSRCAA